MIGQAIHEAADGDAEGGMDRVRGELAERNKDEAPPMHFGVGNVQVPLGNNLLAVEEEIQIDQPRPPLRSFGPAHPPFDLL